MEVGGLFSALEERVFRPQRLPLPHHQHPVPLGQVVGVQVTDPADSEVAPVVDGLGQKIVRQVDSSPVSLPA